MRRTFDRFFLFASMTTLVSACGTTNNWNADGAADGAGDGVAADVASQNDGGLDAARSDVATFTDAQDRNVCPGMGTELSGTVFAPNGQDPIFGAVVYVTPSEPAPISPGVACDTCLVP